MNWNPPKQTKEGVIWEGKSPFTIGTVNENGSIRESFTAKSGEVIPWKWLKLWKESNDVIEFHDNGKFNPKDVETYFKGQQ